MKELEIKVVIDEEGNLSAEASGFEGEECLEVLDELLDEQAALSRRTKKKPEFNAETTRVQKETQRLGRNE